ncbi:MAG: DUF4097 family beta strand repeat-containing protein [Lactovum sp.]
MKDNKNMKQGFKIGTYLVGVGFFFLLISVIVGGFDVFKVTAERKEKEYSFKSNYEVISLETITEDIIIRPSDDDKIHLKTSESKEEYYKIENAKNLTISEAGKEPWYRKFFNVGNFNVSIELYLPEDLDTKLVLDSKDGEVDISDVSIKSLDVKSNNEDFYAENVIAKKDISVTNNNAVIKLEKIQAENIVLENNDSLIKLEDLKVQSLKAKNKNDDIFLKNTQAIKKVSFETVNGEIDIYNLDLTESLNINNKDGDIFVDLSQKEKDYQFDLEAKNDEAIINGKERQGKTGNSDKLIFIRNINGEIELKTK